MERFSLSPRPKLITGRPIRLGRPKETKDPSYFCLKMTTPSAGRVYVNELLTVSLRRKARGDPLFDSAPLKKLRLPEEVAPDEIIIRDSDLFSDREVWEIAIGPSRSQCQCLYHINGGPIRTGGCQNPRTGRGPQVAYVRLR